jgi:signal transduction histidine kinase
MSGEPEKKPQLTHTGMLMDIIVIIVLAILVFAGAHVLDLSETLLPYLTQYEAWELDELFIVAAFLSVALVWVIARRWNEQTRARQALDDAEAAVARAGAELTILNNVIRNDILNELSQLQQDLSPVQTPDSTKVTAAINRIRRQIKFTKEYQDIGTTEPFWQNVADAVMRAKVGVNLGKVDFELDVRDLEICADPLLEKVFFYLIDDALKHGGERLTRIRLHRKTVEGSVVIVCEDNGIGIPADKKGHLFPNEFTGGRQCGYSLFLIKEILAVTGITIRENSRPGDGARFEITVPPGQYRHA